MAKTNPCQVCEEVPDAEFTVSCFHPEIPPLIEGQPVVNVCLLCLVNWAYERTVELAAASAAAQDQPGALEQVEAMEDLEPVGDPEPNGRKPKRGALPTTPAEQETPEAAPAAHD